MTETDDDLRLGRAARLLRHDTPADASPENVRRLHQEAVDTARALEAALMGGGVRSPAAAAEEHSATEAAFNTALTALVAENERLRDNAKKHVDDLAAEMADNIIAKDQLATLQSRLSAAERQNGEMREALKPFAAIHLMHDAQPSEPDMIDAPDLSITPNDVRRARAALRRAAAAGETRPAPNSDPGNQPPTPGPSDPAPADSSPLAPPARR